MNKFTLSTRISFVNSANFRWTIINYRFHYYFGQKPVRNVTWQLFQNNNCCLHGGEMRFTNKIVCSVAVGPMSWPSQLRTLLIKHWCRQAQAVGTDCRTASAWDVANWWFQFFVYSNLANTPTPSPRVWCPSILSTTQRPSSLARRRPPIFNQPKKKQNGT